jgi:hypothetical protein
MNTARQIPADVRDLIVRQLGAALAARWRRDNLEKEKPQAATCGDGQEIAEGAATYGFQGNTAS